MNLVVNNSGFQCQFLLALIAISILKKDFNERCYQPTLDACLSFSFAIYSLNKTIACVAKNPGICIHRWAPHMDIIINNL